jgi:dihydroflavonol-4-reductase
LRPRFTKNGSERSNVPILVTGATGLLGNNLVRQLLHQGRSVRVLVRNGRDPRPLDGLPVEVFEGDVRDADAVGRAMRDVTDVIHAAALVHMGWTRMEESRAINVGGTRNVAQAALAAGARMVHVSSVDALAPGAADRLADEETEGQKVPCPYVVTKRAGEAEIRSLVQQGLKAVIVNPGLMLGPWDWKPSSGRMLLEIAQHPAPFTPRGGISLCDVRDVAAGTLMALEKGRVGQRYILTGHNMTYLEAWRMFAAQGGRSGPICRAGPLMLMIAGAAGDAWTRLTGRETDVNSAGVKLSNVFHYYSTARAQDELGYQNRPVEESIADAWNWFVQWGYVRRAIKRPRPVKAPRTVILPMGRPAIAATPKPD